MTTIDSTVAPGYRWETDPRIAPRLRRAQADGARIRAGIGVLDKDDARYSVEVEFGEGYPVGATANVTLTPDVPFWQLWIDTSIATDRMGATRGQHVAAAHAAALAAQLCIDLNKPTRSRAVDRALSEEVRTLLADREWTFRHAADEFEIPVARFGNLLCGQTAWTTDDMLAIAEVIGNDTAEEFQRLARIAALARVAEVAP